MTDRYNTPEYDSENWHVPLNENFRDISTDVNNLESQVGSGSGSGSIVDGVYDGDLDITGELSISGDYMEHLNLIRGDLQTYVTPTLQGDNGGLQFGVETFTDGTADSDERYNVSLIEKGSEGDEFANLYLNNGEVPVWHAGNLDPSTLGGSGGGWSGDSVINEGWTTIHVDPSGGSDSNDGSSSSPLATIQEAADRMPIINPRGGIEINLAPGTYDEDPVVGPYLGSGKDGGNFRIVGDRDNPGDYRIGSMAIHGCHAINAAAVWGVTFLRENNAISTNAAALYYYACTNAEVDTIQFENSVTEGVSFYGGTSGAADAVDVTNTDNGVVAKGESTVSAYNCTGQANDYPFWATETAQISHRFNNASAGTSSSYFPYIRLDNGSIGFSRNGTRVKNLLVGGTMEATSSKDFVEWDEDGNKIAYSATEADEVRLSHYDTEEIEDEKTIELPDHFDYVTSDDRADVNIQVTTHDMAQFAVENLSTSAVTIRVSDPTTVDYHLSAVREGYEDKQTVTPPEEQGEDPEREREKEQEQGV